MERRHLSEIASYFDRGLRPGEYSPEDLESPLKKALWTAVLVALILLSLWLKRGLLFPGAF
jgi:hypothetical protein